MAESTEVRFARLLRPFPVKRLADTLYHVQAESNGIDSRLIKLLTDTPVRPETWKFELDQIAGDLWSLAQRCQEAQAAVEAMIDEADHQFETAVDALTAAMRGMRDAA